jgi:hypothetical protein
MKLWSRHFSLFQNQAVSVAGFLDIARVLSECFRIFEINIRSSYKMMIKPSDIDMTVVDSVQIVYTVKSLHTVCRTMDDSGSRDIRSKVSGCQKKEFFFCDNRRELKSRSIVDSVTRICWCPEGRFRKTHAGRLLGECCAVCFEVSSYLCFCTDEELGKRI